MDRLSGLMAFVRTAELGSFVAAGSDLGLSPSAVGKSVARLEQKVAVRLFQRSTRSLRLTDEGRAFHERCRKILDDLDDAQEILARSTSTPHGTLRLSVPTVAYHLLLPVLPAFVARYPDVELDIDFSDRFADLIESGIDVAIRSGDLPDSRLTARPLQRVGHYFCAAPAYLARYGTPQCPRDLNNHLGIHFRFPASGKLLEWPLRKRPGEADYRIRTVLTCNNMEAVHGATLAGLGISCMPDFLVKASLASGALQQVLADYVQGSAAFSLVWLTSRHLSPKIRAFVDFLGEALVDSPSPQVIGSLEQNPALIDV